MTRTICTQQKKICKILKYKVTKIYRHRRNLKKMNTGKKRQNHHYHSDYRCSNSINNKKYTCFGSLLNTADMTNGVWSLLSSPLLLMLKKGCSSSSSTTTSKNTIKVKKTQLLRKTEKCQTMSSIVLIII